MAYTPSRKTVTPGKRRPVRGAWGGGWVFDRSAVFVIRTEIFELTSRRFVFVKRAVCGRIGGTRVAVHRRTSCFSVPLYERPGVQREKSGGNKNIRRERATFYERSSPTDEERMAS